MSTDTAFALGTLALLGRRVPDQVRAFLLTALVVDDVVSLAVIATVYSTTSPSVADGGAGALPRPAHAAPLPLRYGLAYFVCGVAIWLALLSSGIDPIVVGLVMGLLTFAYNPPGEALDEALERFRLFREQPTPELARSAGSSLRDVAVVERPAAAELPPLDQLRHRPALRGRQRRHRRQRLVPHARVHSPVTLGVIAGYVIGKPLGFLGASWAVTRLTGGRVLPPVGWASVAGGGTIAGIGFTVSLLIVALALQGDQLRGGQVRRPRRRRSRLRPDLGSSSGSPRGCRSPPGSGPSSATPSPSPT